MLRIFAAWPVALDHDSSRGRETGKNGWVLQSPTSRPAPHDIEQPRTRLARTASTMVGVTVTTRSTDGKPSGINPLEPHCAKLIDGDIVRVFNDAALCAAYGSP